MCPRPPVKCLMKKESKQLNLSEYLDLTTNLQRTQGKEEHAQHHHRDAIGKVQTGGNLQANNPTLSAMIKLMKIVKEKRREGKKEGREREEEPTD